MNCKWIQVVLGISVFFVCIFLLPDTIFNTCEQKVAISLLLLMSYYWVTGAVDLVMTSFLPIIINAIFRICKMSDVLANYSSETIILLLSASILTSSWEKFGLDKRIAYNILKFVGDNFKKQLIFWFFISFILSSFLPNAVVCATITPIAVSMLNSIGEYDIKSSSKASKLLLVIVYAVGLGGLTTPLGGAMNLVVVDYMQKIVGKELYYLSWFLHFLPFIIILIILNLIFLLRDVDRNDTLIGSNNYFNQQYLKLGVISFEEKILFLLFVAASISSFLRFVYSSIFPEFKPAYVFLFFAFLSFVISNKDGKRIMEWKNVQYKIVWEMIYIFAGGLALGTIITNSGAADSFSQFIINLGFSNKFVIILIVLIMTIILSDITSNTATASICIPIVISLVKSLGLNPIPYVYVATIGINLSYTLPTSIRAIPVGYGLSTKYLFKEGCKITLLVVVTMVLLSYFLLQHFDFFNKI